MFGWFPERFSLGVVARDYFRSLRVFGSDDFDAAAAALLFGLPAFVFVVTFWSDYVFPAPAALLSAVSLLAGVLLAAAGQVLTMRARLEDGDREVEPRVRSHVRETMSGLLMAASAALLAAVALGGLAAATAQSAYRVMWWHVALSSASLALLAYLVLMFIATARRLYSTYLEVYENGAPLRKPRRRSQR